MKVLTLRVCTAACMLLLGASFYSAGKAGPAVDAQTDRMLTDQLNKWLAEMPRIEGQRALVTGKVSLDLADCRIQVDISSGFVPRYNGGEFEDQMSDLSGGLWHLSRQVGCEADTRFLFDGKDIDHYFPQDSIKGKASLVMPGMSDGSTAVSAGHGYYLNHEGAGSWRKQREDHNGIVEDDITPAYASELQDLLEARGGRTVHRMRVTAGETHEASGHPWWQMSARYHLEALLREFPGIWHSLPGATGNLRERDEDIRSRPLYANHLAVGELIHLHTNGSTNPTARGTRVIHHADKPQDIPLAASILCYMRELITGQNGYEEFPVAAMPHAGRQGENRLADMPSVIVETAFHSNAEDAVALQDPVFRAASMKGVEKGYRLFLEGKGCTPLKVAPIRNVQLRAGNSLEIPLEFEGYPRYPAMIATTNVGCPPGWKCTDGLVHLPAAQSKVAKITVRCENAGSAPIIWNTRLIDDDGARSPPVRHVVVCIRRPTPVMSLGTQ